jgi:hypothetical protein
VLGVHDAIPEKEQPLTEAMTGRVYQPLESGGRDGAADTVGLEASYLNFALVALAVFPALSVQLPLTVAFIELGPE